MSPYKDYNKFIKERRERETMIWFTADHHFGHKNILKYTNREYESIEQMDDDLIEKWNGKIEPEDDVYYLGDFSFYNKERTLKILTILNGRKHMLLGNHDHKRMANYAIQGGVRILDPIHELKIPDEEMDLKQVIILCHYPLLSWNKMHHGSWMLHGHCHGTLAESDSAARLDVGVDRHHGLPRSYEDVKTFMTKKVFKPVDHHGAK